MFVSSLWNNYLCLLRCYFRYLWVFAWLEETRLQKESSMYSASVSTSLIYQGRAEMNSKYTKPKKQNLVYIKMLCLSKRRLKFLNFSNAMQIWLLSSKRLLKTRVPSTRSVQREQMDICSVSAVVHFYRPRLNEPGTSRGAQRCAAERRADVWQCTTHGIWH